MRKFAFLGALTVLLAACSPSAAPEITAHDGWARATGGSAMTAAYVTIENAGGTDALVGVRSSAGQATLHQSTMEGNVVRMRPVDPGQGLEVPANGKLRLAPGGAHVMIDDLPGPLVAGDSLTLTLQFEQAAPKQVEVAVRSAAEAPAVRQ